MKNTVKWIIIAVLLVALIFAATVLYNKLGEDYAGGNIMENPTDAASDAASELAAPDFEVFDENGNAVRLSDFKGKPVVVNFWATWCYYCKVEMPDFDRAYANYPEVQFVMVNATDGVQETMESAKAYIEEEGFSFDVFYDTKLDAVNAYYVNSFPSTFFIDENGNLIARGSGALDYDSLVQGIEMIR